MKYTLNITGILLAALLVPVTLFADCKEFKIIEFEDRVEAVCVGEPLTEAQQKALREEEKRQDLENKRLNVLEEKRRKDTEAAEAKSQAQADAERKKQETKPVQPPAANRNRINMQKL